MRDAVRKIRGSRDRETMTDEWRLDTLPSDVLLLIFDYCHAFDLIRLSEVCIRFNDIVRDDVLWFERKNQPLATNQTSKRFRERCKKLLCLRTRWHASENWQSGKCEKKILRSWKVKAMPWIRLTKDVLWWSGSNVLSGFRRRNRRNSGPRGPFTDAEKILDRDSIRSDITKFVVRDEFVIGGHSDGSITFFNRDSVANNCTDLRIENAHAGNVNSIDEVPGAIISGSADGTVKLWAQPRAATVGALLTTIDVLDRVWSLAADPTGTTFAVGSSGNSGVPPFKLFDIECYSESVAIRHPWRRGAGILDIVWEDPNVLLTCGYDTSVRKWDIRTGSCVATWTDPTDAALYCISSDHRFTMVTGSQYNGKAVLWDQRMPNYVQLYFLNYVSRASSPVYSIAFDSSHLYGATDRSLIELTFTGYGYHQNDYRNVFRYEWSTPIAQNAIR